MKIKYKEYATGLFEALKNSEEKEHGNIIKKFVDVLIDNNQLSMVDKISDYFSMLWNKEFSIVQAEIKSVQDLDVKMKKELQNYIIKTSHAKKLESIYKKDKNLIGGVIIKFGDKIIDGSLRTKINEIKQKIKE